MKRKRRKEKKKEKEKKEEEGMREKEKKNNDNSNDICRTVHILFSRLQPSKAKTCNRNSGVPGMCVPG